MEAIAEKSIGLNGAVFADRRAELRRRVLKGALVYYNKGYSTFECAVRNISEKGAQVSLRGYIPMPAEFAVRVDGRPGRPAVVRWRSSTAIGIQLTDE